MLMEAKNLRKDYGGTTVLDGASLWIGEGEKVGLVGRNGAGKSTLLRILLGADDDYAGKVSLEPGRNAASVPQYFPDFPGTALDYLLADIRELSASLRAREDALADTLAPAGMERALADYAAAREAYDRAGGDGAEERARRYLSSIGLEAAADTPTASLSGGERNVLALGRALASRSDLLVLDEPGNHLDAWGLAWLESFLAGIPQAVLIVSHNRYLLDRVATRIIELDGGKTVSYAGGWSDYRREKLRASAAQGLDWQADRKRLERLEAVVTRFREIASARPDPAWGKRLRAKVTALERSKAEAAEKPAGDGPRIRADFRAEASKADIAVSVSGYTRTVADPRSEDGRRFLFRDAELLIRAGERVGLVGPNGSGKSTFLADLVSRGGWDDRSLRLGPSLKVGWCPQHQDIFDPNRTVRDEFLGLGAFTEDAALSVLRPFLFSRNDLDSRVGDLSGGERNRLQLARAVLIGADFLVLDEPTNHLDIPAREAIEEALTEFKGTLLVVSHDRWFLDRLVDRIVQVEDCGFTSWDGNFSEFWFRSGATAGSGSAARQGAAAMQGTAALQGAARPGAGAMPGGAARSPARPSSRRGGIQSRAADRAAARSTSAGRGGRPEGSLTADHDARTAARIERLEAERSELERRTAGAVASGDYILGRRLGNELDALARTIDRLYAEWAG